jgi:hypothetical protein
MKKVNLQAWCSYPIFINEEVEVENTNEETLEAKLAEICARVIDGDERPMPAIIDGPHFTEAS